MKILFFNPTGILGGGERNLLDVLTSLRSARGPIGGSACCWATKGRAPSCRGGRSGSNTQPFRLPHAVARIGDAGLSGLSWAASGWRHRTPAAAIATASYVKRLRASGSKPRLPDRIVTNGMKAHVLGRAWTAPPGESPCSGTFPGFRPLPSHHGYSACCVLRPAGT